MTLNLRRNYLAIADLTPPHANVKTGVHGAGTGQVVVSPTNGQVIYLSALAGTVVGGIYAAGTADVRIGTTAPHGVEIISGSTIAMTATDSINMTAATINFLSPTVLPNSTLICAVEGSVVWANSAGTYKIGVYINGSTKWATLT